MTGIEMDTLPGERKRRRGSTGEGGGWKRKELAKQGLAGEFVMKRGLRMRSSEKLVRSKKNSFSINFHRLSSLPLPLPSPSLSLSPLLRSTATMPYDEQQIHTSVSFAVAVVCIFFLFCVRPYSSPLRNACIFMLVGFVLSEPLLLFAMLIDPRYEHGVAESISAAALACCGTGACGLAYAGYQTGFNRNRHANIRPMYICAALLFAAFFLFSLTGDEARAIEASLWVFRIGMVFLCVFWVAFYVARQFGYGQHLKHSFGSLLPYFVCALGCFCFLFTAFFWWHLMFVALTWAVITLDGE